MGKFKNYLKSESADEVIEKAFLIGASVTIALIIVLTIGRKVGEMIGLLNS